MTKKATEILIAMAIVTVGVWIGTSFAFNRAPAAPAPAPAPAANIGGQAFDITAAYFPTWGSGVTATAGEPSATTSVGYLKTGDTATSSITGFTGNAVSVDLNLFAVASTSGTSNLQWFVSFSPNKIDWYREDCSTITSNVLITHGATACVHNWAITGSGAQLKNVSISATQARYFKVDFGVTGANASLWAEAVPKAVTPN